MPLDKQTVTINFDKGVNQKRDPFQLPIGDFDNISNAVFTKTGRMTKRNGFGSLPALPDTTSTYLTTFSGNLTAIGQKLQAYSQGSNTWVNKGNIQPCSLSTLPLIRNSTNQSQVDTAISANGFVCTVYTDQVPSSGTNVPILKYAVADSVTSQNIVIPTAITSSFGTATFAPRVFLLGNNFIIVFASFNGSIYHLQYITVSTTNPQTVSAATDISTSFTATSTGSFDGVVANNTLYLAFAGASGAGVQVVSLSSTLIQSSTKTFSGSIATMISVCADLTGSSPNIWLTFFDSSGVVGKTICVDAQLNTLLAATSFTTDVVLNIATTAQNGILSIFYEVSNNYTYDSSVPTHFIRTKTVNLAGTVSSASIVSRSVGLASKGFIYKGISYFLSAYSSPYQPTYFLMNGSGNVIAKLAYGNGGGYVVTGLTSVYVSSNSVSVGYLFKDSVESVNKNTNVAAGTQVAGIYSQLGINLATLILGTSGINTSETANDLHLNGGFLWMYDGYVPVEHNFFLYPDSIEVTGSTSGGSIGAGVYYYQATYEWSDNQGNIHKSAPSIPVTVTTTGTTSSVTVNIPTLRLTYKTANPVKIVVYRWSQNQQTYYQATLIATPLLNDPTVDSVQFVDKNLDTTILGNNLLYTNGNNVEYTNGPASTALTLFDDRLWLIDAEDGSLWFSNTILPTTPVQMSQFLTYYIASSTGSSGSTGKPQCIFPMDDKLIAFLHSPSSGQAIYYINGTGPDSTGANSNYSPATFITTTVSCVNQNSLVLSPDGLMFQAADGKGIWILKRDLSTEYIGAGVENYNSYTVESAVNVPGTNQIRFTMSNGVTLMYDYYTGEWGTFINNIGTGISSTIYQNLHTYINASGAVFQETPGLYLDGTIPVVMGFTTGWINAAGLQGYQRAYYFFFLGQYQTPHKLSVGIAYDYDPAINQQPQIAPTNYAPVYGSDSVYGGSSVYGGPSQAEPWKISFQKQQCNSFKITFTEQYDPSFGVAAGAGLTISGLDLVIGINKSYPKNIGVANKAG